MYYRVLLKFWCALFCLVSAFNLMNAANYYRPDVFTYNTKEPNWKRPPHDRIVMCGINWKSRNTKEDLENFNATLCTHLVYRLASFDANAKINDKSPGNKDQISCDSAISILIDAKKKFPHLRVLTEFALNIITEKTIFADRKTRLSAAENVIDFMKRYKFDGIILALRLPQSPSADYETERDKLFDLIQIICTKLWKKEIPFALKLVNYNHRVLSAYRLRRMIEYADYFIMYMDDMEYTFKTWFPLHCSSETDPFCLDYQIRKMIFQGIPMNRVLISLPMGGVKMWTVDERIARPGLTPLRRDKSSELMTLPTVCSALPEKQEYVYGYYFNNVGHNNYGHRYGYNAHKNRFWSTIIAYETSRTVIHKVRFAMKFGVRGFYLPQASWDDIHGKCTNKILEDEYTDVEDDFSDIKDNKHLPKVYRMLNFPNETTLKSRYREFLQMYIKKDKTLELFKPQRADGKHTLLRGVTDGIVYAEQEQAVFEALKVKKQVQGTRMLWRDEVWQMFPREY